MSLHFLNDGSFEICLNYNLTPYYIQAMLIMKALVNTSDISICNDVLKYCKDFPVLKLKNMLQMLHEQGIHCQNHAKFVIGKLFYCVLNIAPGTSYIDAADFLFKKSLLVHLDKLEDKFEFLCFSLCKLHCVVTKQCRLDDLDNPVYQEVLSCGQTYLLILKAGMAGYLKSVKSTIERSSKSGNFKFEKVNLQSHCNKAVSLSPQVASAISTGNFNGKVFGLTSETGYTVSLARNNIFELAAQLTAICKFSIPHYTKEGRSYYSESWGFLCPTQTPEGENCGLYNHLASQCKVVELSDKRIRTNVIFKFGVIPYNDPVVYHSSHYYYPVIVDGRVNGLIHEDSVGKLILKLKELKVLQNSEVPQNTEIVFISKDLHLFPGVYIFSSSCRMVRRCLNIHTSKVEFIGGFEQLFPNMRYSETGGKTEFLSLSASMIPFFENNAAVRNIFSSVKVKQAVGIPFHNFSGRADTKTSHSIYCQSPVVSNKIYSESNFDFYPYGTNVIIAVLSYTGFDMEDALILNKASIERGIMDNMVYKTIYYDFEELAKECECTPSELEFKRDEDDPYISHFLDENGLPFIGAKVKHNSPVLSVYNKRTRRCVMKYYHERYDACISAVRLMGDMSASNTTIPKNSKKISITYCTKKIPEVGDKFNNRHGGKGICSALIPSEDLPFTADGMVPDVLFNPHGLPSRLSVGFLFEMATAKIHITKGSKYIVEPFQMGKSKKTYENIGEALIEAGFDYYGTEKFYSGTSGEELDANVFCGSTYYLRLHHVVQEKFQVRSLGPVDDKTYQPINPGKSGAIRFGEMERDAILSHGAVKLTLDRLLLNSDKCIAYLCTKCHQMLHPVLQHPLPYCRPETSTETKKKISQQKFCRLCSRKSTYKIQIPYVLIYLISELSVLGIKLKFSENT